MKREIQFLQAMNDIEDSYLSEVEAHINPEKQKKRNPKPVRWLLIALAVLVCLSASAYAAIQWNPFFMEKFHPSDAIIQKTRSIVQNVQAVSQCGDITLRVEQTVGDENILYIKLDVLLPEGSTWRDVASKELVEEADNILIRPESWYIYQTAISWDELSGMTAAEIKEKLAEKQIGMSFGSSSESVSCDSSGYTMLLQVTAQDQQWNDDGITLLIPSFISNRYGQTYSVLDGPFVISWKPENSGIHYEFIMENKKDHRPIGRVYLSPFQLQVQYKYDALSDSGHSAKPYATSEEFRNDIILHFRDGTEKKGDALSKNASVTFGAQWGSYHVTFGTILDLDTVESVQVGPYIYRLEE